MRSKVLKLHLVLNWDKGKIKPCKFANLTAPETACVDHPDICHICIFGESFSQRDRIGIKPCFSLVSKFGTAGLRAEGHT